MKVLFNKHRKYGANPKVPGMEKGLNCTPKKVHDLPDALKEDKFFKAHLAKGDCSFVEDPSAHEEKEEVTHGGSPKVKGR